MSAQTLLSGGDKWYSYSGEVFGDVSVPATISMILIPNTGLRDSVTQLQPYFGQAQGVATNDALGIMVKLNDVIIYKSQGNYLQDKTLATENMINLFIPRQSKVEVISINTTQNNTQIRGVNVLGYYL